MNNADIEAARRLILGAVLLPLIFLLGVLLALVLTFSNRRNVMVGF